MKREINNSGIVEIKAPLLRPLNIHVSSTSELSQEWYKDKNIFLLIADGSFNHDNPPKGMKEVSKQEIDDVIHIEYIDDGDGGTQSNLSVVYFDHHAKSEYSNQVTEIDCKIDIIISIISKLSNKFEVLFCTPRADADSVGSLAMVWFVLALQNTNLGKYNDDLRIDRLKKFKNGLIAQAQWGDTFGFKGLEKFCFTKLELLSFEQIAQYLNRLPKNSAGIDKGIEVLNQIFENVMNGFALELPFEFSADFHQIMGLEAVITLRIIEIWQKNELSIYYYDKGVIYIDISDLEKELDYSIDAELLGNILFNSPLKLPAQALLIIRRSRPVSPGNFYYSFSSPPQHPNHNQFVGQKIMSQILTKLNIAENTIRETDNIAYFKGREVAAGSPTSDGSRLTPNVLLEQIIEFFDADLPGQI